MTKSSWKEHFIQKKQNKKFAVNITSAIEALRVLAEKASFVAENRSSWYNTKKNLCEKRRKLKLQKLHSELTRHKLTMHKR